jgi:hypothetical protein
VPERHQAYLRIGQIRAEQGFLPDARTNFLTYAERMQQSGRLDESFRALIEFCDLAPDDVGVRVTVAEQMGASGRGAEAVEQLLIARRYFAQTGDQAQAENVEARILELDPDADLSAVPPIVEAYGGGSGAYGGGMGDFGDISLGGPSDDHVGLERAAQEFVTASETAATEESAPVPVLDAIDGDFELSSSDSSEEEVELPVDFASDLDEDEDTVELPTFDFEDDAEDDAVELPMMDFDSDLDEEDEGEVVELPMMSFDDDEDEAAGAVADAVEEAMADEFVEPAPEPPPPPRRRPRHPRRLRPRRRRQRRSPRHPHRTRPRARDT